MADAPLFVYIPQLNKSAHVSVGQFWSIDLQTAVTFTGDSQTLPVRVKDARGHSKGLEMR